jgi:Fe-S-cluster containining protein
MTSDTADIPLCVRCSRSRKTCCQVSEIYCGAADKQRIAEYTGRTDFYTFVVAEGDWAPGDDDPPWRDLAFRPDGSRRILARRADGDCTFLGSAGCTLPMETRPLICRLYPFDYDHQGLRPQLSHHCPTQLMKPGETLLGALDMTREVAERWRAQLYRELELERDDEDRADLRPAQ